MAPHSRFSLSLALAAATLTLALVAPLVAHHYFKHDFYIYDVDTGHYIVGATITITYPEGSNYPGGSQSLDTQRPHGNVQFVLPGELETAQVVVTADGYCDYANNSFTLGGRPHVGGRGIWIALWPCGPRP